MPRCRNISWQSRRRQNCAPGLDGPRAADALGRGHLGHLQELVCRIGFLVLIEGGATRLLVQNHAIALHRPECFRKPGTITGVMETEGRFPSVLRSWIGWAASWFGMRALRCRTSAEFLELPATSMIVPLIIVSLGGHCTSGLLGIDPWSRTRASRVTDTTAGPANRPAGPGGSTFPERWRGTISAARKKPSLAVPGR